MINAFIPVAAMAEAARYVEREWGERYGIRHTLSTSVVVPGDTFRRVHAFEIHCFIDGAEFAVATDQYGNCISGDTANKATDAWKAKYAQPELCPMCDSPDHDDCEG